MAKDVIVGLVQAFALLLVFFAASSGAVQADTISVSQMGYHPDSNKQAVVYTDATSGSLTIMSGASQVATVPLSGPKDYSGNAVKCQGNNPCIVGDFSSFKQEGTYTAVATVNGRKLTSYPFKISRSIYEQNVPVFMEFFDAMKQQGSSYHADLNSYHSPKFLAMADGSFIMEADQAALPLIRLGSAYRRNPTLLKGKAQEHILTYVDYLISLQGVEVKETSGSGFRLDPGMKVNNAFMPGPARFSSLDVYAPGNPPKLIDTVPMISLCGADDGSANWDGCVAYAADFYRCQVDEPCLNMSYIGKTGMLLSNDKGYGVSRGWGYEFGCFIDIDTGAESFNSQPNPCMIFYPESNREYTATALLGFLEAYPAVNDYSATQGKSLLTRSVNTYNYIKQTYPSFSASDKESGFWGASLFLLYDYTGDVKYLNEAHAHRSKVSPTLIADATRGNEFYWEEYARHKKEITGAGLQYQINGVDPSDYFRGKIYGDYKDRGERSISRNGERVFEFDSNIQFQNSRFILTEGLIATKATDLNPGSEALIKEVSDNQLAWMTGMNGVQDGVAFGSPITSYSFILGIGSKFPSELHTRYFVDTGHKSGSSGKIVGARGTGLQFYNGSDYIYADGVAHIQGQTLGALGNGHDGEKKVVPYVRGQEFRNGKTYIPGWINGAFDINTNPKETDVIFNYDDNMDTYEFTETTNEIVATAVEYMAFKDAKDNKKPKHKLMAGEADTIDVNVTIPPITNSTNGSGGTNTTDPGNDTPQPGSLDIFTSPDGADVLLNGQKRGTTDSRGELLIEDLEPGKYSGVISKKGYLSNTTIMEVKEGESSLYTFYLLPVSTGGSTNNSTTKPNSSDSTGGSGNSSNQTGDGTITDHSVNLTAQGGGRYHILGSDSAKFTVTLDKQGTVEWSVDGEVVDETGESEDHEFIWAPGHLYSSNVKTGTVTASSGDSEVSWKVDVEYVINPFFAGDTGDEDAEVHVFINRNVVVFDRLEVEIFNDRSKSTKTLQLVNVFNDSKEMEWVANFTAEEGNNYLTKVIGYSSGDTVEYELGKERAHYMKVSSRDKDSEDRQERRERREQEEERKISGKPELVYVSFEKDVLNVTDVQTIILDAKNFRGGVTAAQVILMDPEGNIMEFDLELTGGNKEYGTWSEKIQGFIPGQYLIDSVRLWGAIGNSVVIPVSDRSFYARGEDEVNYQPLELVYAVLGRNSVDAGTSVKIKADAMDIVGVTSVDAHVVSNRNHSFNVSLTLVGGDPNYGTWEGSFNASSPDTTYSLDAVTLSNGDESKTFSIDKRSVYVKPDPNSAASAGPAVKEKLTLKAWIRQFTRKPLVPTLIGFTLMAIIVTLGFLNEGFRGIGSKQGGNAEE